MQSSKSTHVRIRDGNDYTTNVEDLIKGIEKEFNIDFRSLGQWQSIVKRLHVAQTDCLRKIQCANERKAKIIEKLYLESKPKTSNKGWDLPKYKVMLVPPLILSDGVGEEEDEEHVEENIVEDGDLDTLHPNTENTSGDRVIIEPLELNTGPLKIDAEVQYSVDSAKLPAINLPVFICTNTHKLISPLSSKIRPLSYHSLTRQVNHMGESEIKEWEPSTSAVICKPTPIYISNNTLKQQTLLFSLTNCTSEYLHVRFKYVTNYSPFKKINLLPKIPKRLYPGIAVMFKLVFKLQCREEFKTGLYFKIGRDVYENAPTEPLFIPILGTFTSNLQVTISETVNIPPVYSWHIKMEPESDYPSGAVTICLDEAFAYHLHIYKQRIDLSEESMISFKRTGLDTDIFKECDSLLQSLSLYSKQSVKSREMIDQNDEPKTSLPMDVIPQTSTEMILTIIDDIVQLALEAFIFDRTYTYLQPHSRTSIPVYFTKAEYVGFHHSYYDFYLINPETETVALKKTVTVLTEVLPHPIEITPIILDMSKSPVSHGYFEDRFIISNTHKLCPATIYIKLTTKMKKIFYVDPMRCVVPAQSSVPFEVKFCSRDYLSPSPSEDLVHFTFKIIVVGNKMVYKNVPPIFYEIIAPCAVEFKKVYNDKYFKEAEPLTVDSEHKVQQ